MSAAARRNRWAVSFADLLLLLLGFFVLLQASGNRSAAMISGVGQQFGARPMRQSVELRAVELFAPGEAMLTPAGRARIAAAAKGLRSIEVTSHGTDRAQRRFDDWDLAAARLGAVARALKADGIKLMIRGLDQADGQGGKGQRIQIAPGPTAGK